MENILQQQDEAGDKIVQIETNYRKDGEDRKTVTYLEKKLATVKAIYNNYVDNDTKILAMTPPLEKGHAYLERRKKVTDVYHKLIIDMHERLNTATTTRQTEQQKHSSDEKATTTEEINNKKLFKRQDVLMRQMYQKLASINYSLETNNISKEYINIKLKQLEKDIHEVANQHTAILIETEEDEQTSDYFKKDYFGQLQEKVEATMIELQRSHVVNTTTSEPVQMKLPKIELPNFYGEYERWETFNDIFTEMIHQNNKISDTVKMTYLKSHLQKGAAQLISHLTTTGDNYQTAWSIIQNRYNNARLLANHQFSALLSLTTIQMASAQAVRNLHDTAKEILHNINRLKISSSFEAFVSFILMKKLDPESIRLYESSIEKPRDIPQLEEVFKFLEKRFQSLEAMGNNKPTTSRPQYIPPLKRAYTTTASRTCWVNSCTERHNLDQCQQFKRLSTLERSRLINAANLCVRCLNSHQSKYCQAEPCVVCKGSHNTLLHCNNGATGVKNAKTLIVNQQGQVLLPTAVVNAITYTGNQILLRALIDPGSQVTLISSKAANLLNLKKKKVNVSISGIGGDKAGDCKHTINIQILPRFKTEFQLNIEALIFDKLNQQLPEVDFDARCWTHLKQIQLADPHYNKSQPIDLILGADYYPAIINNNIIKGGALEPMAQQTEIGWIIIGSRGSTRTNQQTTMIATKGIEDQLKLLIEVDSIPESRSNTEEEDMVEQHFQLTSEKGSDGKYVVRIPFKDNHIKLGESRKKAAARLIQIENRFKRDSSFKQLYHQFMQEYINLKHMELVQEEVEDHNIASNTYYIPHHGVIKQDSTTTKLRVVFDASAKTTTGVSLNDCMMNGPKLQDDLTDILLRWRKYKIVMTADIEKMYRQIWINEQDQNYQRILWRTQPSKPMSTYKLKTVTYGTTAASFLAIRALRQLALDGASEYPVAAPIILKDFYVDDLLTGCHNIKEACQSVRELKLLTDRGGFNLRKWFSNSSELLKHIPRELHGKGNMEIKLNDCIKTLGILYDPKEDIFKFDVARLQLSNNRATKRSLLSESSKLFDPVGWLSPLTITAKIMMQELWLSGIKWDEHLPEHINSKWIKYKEELGDIKNIKIQRWINTTENTETELHGFADASEYAYAAVIYCRTVNEDGTITTQLLTSKTRVAPTKVRLSIPRLELNAALLLSKLLKHVQEALHLNNCRMYAWSDSTIALCWITGEPSKFKAFVANRISAVKSLIPSTTWHHVKSGDNPADIASRGAPPSALTNNKLWWQGPDFLRQNITSWKEVNSSSITYTHHREELEEKTSKLMAISREEHVFNKLFERCSNYNRLKRIVAYCKRFINNAKHGSNNHKQLTGTELRDAEITILKALQQQDFSNEIRCLNHAKQISKGSKLLSLNPTLDEKGLLRLNGRLQNSALASSSKNPIILDKHNIVTQRIIENAHISTLHGGAQLTLSHLRNKYWIIDGKRAVRRVIQKCIICFRNKQHPTQQQMGNLPAVRVRPGRPFAKTGIDYAGPIQVRTTKGRGHKTHKGYIALFICMVTKAVHIEIVSDLTTESFIAAYKRFTSRRGLCTDLYSDNGTYFVGANKVMLKDHHRAITTLPDEIATMIANDETNWHFIPPMSPHFGGIWEAGIKSIKFHLKRIIGEATLTFEELYTVVTQIEACLNSRPLTPLTNNPTDLSALTPGHFLIGDSLKSLPVADTGHISLKTRWHLVEKMVQDFWRRWSSEYLHQLQQRTKWKCSQPNLKINDLVLLKDDQQPTTRWKLGRIIETHAGSDDLVRVATVKCENNTFKRPIVKLCKLPIEENLKDLMPMKANRNEKEQESQTSKNPERILRQQPRRHVKNQGKLKHLMLATLSMCCILGLAQANIDITPFNHPTGIHFESIGRLEVVATKWSLIIYYNMSNYWEEIEAFKTAQSQLKRSCIDVVEINCELILQQIQWQFNNLESDNELLLASNKEVRRPKRGLGDTIGVVLGDLFGILTEREAREYESQFEAINNDQHHLEALIKNHTTVIDNTVKLIKHNSILTMKSLNKLIDDHGTLKAELEQLNEYFIREKQIRLILTSTIELILILKNLEDTQQALLDVIHNAHKNILHPSLLSPAQLDQELEIIKRHIASTITIPGHGIPDLLHVYHSMKIRSRVTLRNIKPFTISLSFTREYTLLAVFPVPNIEHKDSQSYIDTKVEYIAIDAHREQLALMTREQVKNCQSFQGRRFLCEISPIYNIMSSQAQCEVAILQRKMNLEEFCSIGTVNATNHWIKLNANNQWIYAIYNETTVDVICGHESKSYNLQGSGIVKIKAGCVLRDANFYIIAIGSYSNHLERGFNRSVNTLAESIHLKKFITRIKNSPVRHNHPQYVTLQDTNKLEQQIKTLENMKIQLHEGKNHHIHHYTMTHVITGILLLLGVIWGIKSIRQRRANPGPPPSPLQRAEA